MDRPLIVVFTINDDSTKDGYLHRLLGKSVVKWLWRGKSLHPVLISRDGGQIYDHAAGESQHARADVVLFRDGKYDRKYNASWIDTIASPMFRKLGVPGRSVGVVLHQSSVSHSSQLDMLDSLVGGLPPGSCVMEHHNTGDVFDQLRGIAEVVHRKDHRDYEAAIQRLISRVLGDPQLEAKLDLLHALLVPPVEGSDPPQWAVLEKVMGTDPELAAIQAAWSDFRSRCHVEASSIAGSDVAEALHAYWDPKGPLAIFRDALLGTEP